MAKRIRVQTGCPNCRQCTGTAFTGKGRDMGRATATIATFGVAKMARRMCKACDHPMSEHQTHQVAIAPQAPTGPQAPVAPPPMPAGWYADPTDNRALCWWDGTRWHPETKHYRT